MESVQQSDTIGGSITRVPCDDSTLYLFGPELYCGWCLESFLCPVRLKIHFHVKHLATCSCGEKFSDKDSLGKHIVASGCLLPAPFQWSHFLSLPCIDASQLTSAEASIEKEDNEKSQMIKESDLSDSNVSSFCDENTKDSVTVKNAEHCEQQVVTLKKHRCKFCPYASMRKHHVKRHVLNRHKDCKLVSEQNSSTVDDCYETFHVVAKVRDEKQENEKSHLIKVDDPSDRSTLSSCDEYAENNATVKDTNLRDKKVFTRQKLRCKLCPYVAGDTGRIRYHMINKHKKRVPQNLSAANVFFETLTVVEHGKFCCKYCTYVSNISHNVLRHCKQRHKNQHPCFRYKHSTESKHTLPARSSSGATDERSLDERSKNRKASSSITMNETVSDKMPSVCENSQDRKMDCVKAGDLNPSLPGFDQQVNKKIGDVQFFASYLSALVGSKQLSPGDGWNEQLNKSCTVEHSLATAGNSMHVDKFKVSTSMPYSVFMENNHASGTSASNQAPENRMKPTLTADELKVLVSSLCKPVGAHHETVVSDSTAKEGALPLVSQQLTAVAESHIVKVDSEDAKNTPVTPTRCQCKYCCRVYSSRYNCQQHELTCVAREAGENVKDGIMRQIHGSGVYFCRRCGYSDSDQSVVRAHLMEPNVHHAVKRLNVNLDPHHDCVDGMRISRGNFQCRFCGLHFSSRSKLLGHLQYHSSPVFLPGDEGDNLPLNGAALGRLGAQKQRRRLVPAGCGSHTKSCPKCRRSFSTVAAFLRHRAMCRTVQHNESTRCYSRRRKSYLISYCKQTTDGRWQCKLCDFTGALDYHVYRHLRAKHSEVVKSEAEAKHSEVMKSETEAVEAVTETRKTCVKDFCMETEQGRWQCKLCEYTATLPRNVYRHIRRQHSEVMMTPSRAKPYIKDICKATKDGRWQCKLCTSCLAYRGDLYKHIRAKHAANVNPGLEPPKLKDLSAFCEKAANGMWQCKICKYFQIFRPYMFRHIRTKHRKLVAVEAPETSSPSSVSSVKMKEKYGKKSSLHSELQKSQGNCFLKSCPKCHRRFFSRSLYHTHMLACGSLYLNSFLEKMSNGRVKCGLCHRTYSSRGHCVEHLRHKHLKSESGVSETVVKTENASVAP